MGDAFDVLYYQTSAGRVPFRDWLARMKNEAAFAAVKVRIDRLRRGLFGDCKPVGAGLLELRIDIGPGYRIYLARRGASAIVLCGGDKGTQDADIERAKRYWSDYEKRASPRSGAA